MNESGFTLLELVVVIIIAGILASMLVSTFSDADSTARQDTTNSVAAALTAAAMHNERLALAGASYISIDNCNDIPNTLPSGGLPTGYTIDSQAIANGASATCTVSNDNGTTTATFQAAGRS